MKKVGAFIKGLLQIQPQPIETYQPVLRGFKRRRRVHALVVSATVAQEKGERLRTHLRDVQQIVLVTYFGELGELTLRTHSLQIIGIFAMQANQVLARGIGERRFGEELRQARVALDENILAEVLFVEECPACQTMLLLEVAIEELPIALHRDA